MTREEALKILPEMKGCGSEWDTALDLAVDALKQPERPTGRWIPQDHNKKHGNVTTCMYYYPVCSECGHTGNFDMNYCPNCGSYNGGGA